MAGGHLRGVFTGALAAAGPLLDDPGPAVGGRALARDRGALAGVAETAALALARLRLRLEESA